MPANDSKPFAHQLNKAFVLAPMATVADGDFSLNPDRSVKLRNPNDPTSHDGFKRAQFEPQKNYSAWGNRAALDFSGFWADTQTGVARLWADWNAIQLNGPKYNDPCLQALDVNIRDAKADGYTVILTSRGFPGWVTGYATDDGNGNLVTVNDGETVQQYQDRVSQDPVRRAQAAIVYNALAADRAAGGGLFQLRWPGTGPDPQNPNTPHAELLAPGQPWHTWITFLARRYHPHGPSQGDLLGNGSPPPRLAGATIDVLEVVNEPNFEIWPQTAAASRRTIGAFMTAEILRQAVGIQAAVNDSVPDEAKLYFAGPATSDFYRRADTGRATSSYHHFLRRLATYLGPDFDPGPDFLFTHHNYTDVEVPRERPATANQKQPTSRTNSTAWVLQLMRGHEVQIRTTVNGATVRRPFRWRGWPNGSYTDSMLAITEGGARLSQDGVTRRTQGTLVRNAYKLVKTGKNARGQRIKYASDGVVLFSNFLTWIDPAGVGLNDSYLLPAGPFVRNGQSLVIGAMTDAMGAPTRAELQAVSTSGGRTGYTTWRGLRP